MGGGGGGGGVSNNLKGLDTKYLSFVGHMISVLTIHLCCYSTKVAKKIDNM